MQFSDTSTRQGLIQDCEDLCGFAATGISGTSATLQSFTRWINTRYMEATGLIISADGRWQWDDSNQTNQPVATFSLVIDQQDYSIISAAPDTDKDWLVIDKVELKDSNGDWYFLNPVDKSDANVSIDEVYSISGTPLYYDMEGTSIKLYPASNYTSTDGAKIWFKRAPLLFATTDTTKRPGFASIFHRYLSIGASLDYCVTKDMERAKNLSAILDGLKIEILKYYGRRTGYERKRITRRAQTYK